MKTRPYNAKLKVLMDLTSLRANSLDRVEAAVPEVHDFPRLKAGKVIAHVYVDGMAELQADMLCDQCKRELQQGETVLGKLVSTVGADGPMTGSFFSPTCLSCFMEDRGGYYSVALAALVMGT